MDAPFFITGLPRSRTAWLANFFTTQTAFCLHDACKDGWTAEHIRSEFDTLALHYKQVGDSDSGLLLIADKLVKIYPEARWVFIRNTPERAAKSYREYFTGVNACPWMPKDADIETIMGQAAEHYEHALAEVPEKQRIELPVDFLDDPALMHVLWHWVVPHLRWNTERWRMLNTFRVNIIPQKITVKIPTL